MKKAIYTDTAKCKACGMEKDKVSKYGSYKFCSGDCEMAYLNYPTKLGKWWRNGQEKISQK